jgi:hypothetical protein
MPEDDEDPRKQRVPDSPRFRESPLDSASDGPRLIPDEADTDSRLSPVDFAQAVRIAGRQLLEIKLPVGATKVMAGGEKSAIELIESDGWKLEHVGYVREPTLEDELMGIYLFRRVD